MLLLFLTRHLLQPDLCWLMAMKDCASAKRQSLQLDIHLPTSIMNCYAWGSTGGWRKSAAQLLVTSATSPVWNCLCILFFFTSSCTKRMCQYFSYQGAILRFFAIQGWLFSPIVVKFGVEESTFGGLFHAKFHSNRRRGGGMGSQNWKFYSNFLIINVLYP